MWAFLSDTHIDKDPNFIARKANVAENLRKVVAEVLEAKVNGVLIDGDCAYNRGLKGDYEVLAEAIKPLIDAKLPIHMTLGNHDDRGPFYSTFAAMKPEQPVVESKHVGLVEAPFANFIFLDTLRFVNKVEGELGKQQLQWLTETLDAFPDKPALLIGHHYPQVVQKRTVNTDKKTRITGLVDTEPFLKLIAQKKQAKAYIYGHSHNWKVNTNDQGFTEINLPPTAYVFNPARPNGWVKATISSGGMSMELRALNQEHPEHGKITDISWKN